MESGSVHGEGVRDDAGCDGAPVRKHVPVDDVSDSGMFEASSLMSRSVAHEASVLESGAELQSSVSVGVGGGANRTRDDNSGDVGVHRRHKKHKRGDGVDGAAGKDDERKKRRKNEKRKKERSVDGKEKKKKNNKGDKSKKRAKKRKGGGEECGTPREQSPGACASGSVVSGETSADDTPTRPNARKRNNNVDSDEERCAERHRSRKRARIDSDGDMDADDTVDASVSLTDDASADEMDSGASNGVRGMDTMARCIAQLRMGSVSGAITEASSSFDVDGDGTHALHHGTHTGAVHDSGGAETLRTRAEIEYDAVSTTAGHISFGAVISTLDNYSRETERAYTSSDFLDMLRRVNAAWDFSKDPREMTPSFIRRNMGGASTADEIDGMRAVWKRRTSNAILYLSSNNAFYSEMEEEISRLVIGVDMTLHNAVQSLVCEAVAWNAASGNMVPSKYQSMIAVNNIFSSPLSVSYDEDGERVEPKKTGKTHLINYMRRYYLQRGYVKVGGGVGRRVIVEGDNGRRHRTYTIKREKSIKKSIYDAVHPEFQSALFEMLTGTTAKVAASIEDDLTLMDDHCLPEVDISSTCFEYTDGLVYTDGDGIYVTKYSDPGGIKPKPNVYSHVYFENSTLPDLGFIGDLSDPTSYTIQDVLGKIKTETLDKMFLVDQHYREGRNEDTYTVLLCLMGRFLSGSKAHKHDRWRVIPAFKGMTGTGKSTILAFMASFFAADKVGLLSTDQERVFGIGTLYGKDVFINHEMENGTRISANQYKNLATGDQMYLAIKYKDAITDSALAIHGWQAGNNFLGFGPATQYDGSIPKRTVTFPMPYVPNERTGELPDLLEAERGAIHLKCLLIYKHIAKLHGKRDFWEVMGTPLLVTTRDIYQQVLNPLYQFLRTSEDVAFDKDAHCSPNQLRAAFERWFTASSIEKSYEWRDDNVKSTLTIEGLGLEVVMSNDKTNPRLVMIRGMKIVGMSGMSADSRQGSLGGGDHHRDRHSQTSSSSTGPARMHGHSHRHTHAGVSGDPVSTAAPSGQGTRRTDPASL